VHRSRRTLAHFRRSHLYHQKGCTYSFSYDAQNRRTGIDYESRKFIYQGLNVVDMSYRKAGGYFRSNYLFGPGIDEPLARVDSTDVTYYSVDGLGSVILLTDGAGTVKNKYAYGSWGERQTASESLVQPFLYTSRESLLLDAPVFENLYYYRARSMMPGIGRFISEDPLLQWSGLMRIMFAIVDRVVRQQLQFRLQEFSRSCDRRPALLIMRTFVHDRFHREIRLACSESPILRPVSPIAIGGVVRRRHARLRGAIHGQSVCRSALIFSPRGLGMRTVAVSFLVRHALDQPQARSQARRFYCYVQIIAWRHRGARWQPRDQARLTQDFHEVAHHEADRWRKGHPR
jgi:hypothetical protein